MPPRDAPVLDPVTVNPAWKIAIVRSTWHNDITKTMAAECSARLLSLGVPPENIREITAPGSFEVPLFCQLALTERGFDGAIAFGVILQGATHHAELVGRETARACMEIQMQTGKPLTFEILYVNTIEDARSRSTGKNGKGPLAADTILTCLAKKEELQR